MFFVSEIFESIQGEGNYAGAYSLFIRFQYCNLTCSWCDTKYTWFPDSGRFKQFTAQELRNKISEARPSNIIFTGGEPTLYPLDQLIVEGKRFHVETNGFYIPTEALKVTLHSGKSIEREAMSEDVISQFNWVVSPKLSNSRQPLNESSLKYWADKTYAIFKFVTRNESDLSEVEAIVDKFEINRPKVFVALEGQTLESQLKPEMVDAIIRKGFNFSPRLHVLLWGNKREK